MSDESLLISDFAGHPFTWELADALSARDRKVAYSYCAAVVTPKGSFEGNTQVIPVGAGARFERYQPLRRVLSEVRYGMGLVRAVCSIRPTVHVLCNMPIISGLIASVGASLVGARTVVWFQDVQSGLASGSLSRRWMTIAFSAAETLLLRCASGVIAISPELASEAERRGVRPDRVGVLPNWAPVEKMPTWDRDTPWLREQAIAARPLFVYSGTLGLKHDASLLVDLADAIHGLGGHVLVVSEGPGADWLDVVRTQEDVENISVLPYQPFDRLPEVLASADVLVVLLDPSAGRYSVPSKTLSYLCAGRAILASVPADNSIARLVRDESGAGVVVRPDERDAFLREAVALATDPGLRATLGEAGRQYASSNFAEDVVITAFEQQLDALVGPRG
jgi:glycosyltransferase involved in cell wall biosynthesis